MRLIAAALLLTLTSACATVFTGQPKVANGPAGCKQVCANWGMELSGMIAMGEYSDGCICQVPGKQLSPAAASAAGPAAVGVLMQMEQQQRQHQAFLQSQHH